MKLTCEMIVGADRHLSIGLVTLRDPSALFGDTNAHVDSSQSTPCLFVSPATDMTRVITFSLNYR